MPGASGSAALLVDPLDESAIYNAMGQLFGDAQLRARLASLGLERATGFSWVSVARSTAGAFEAALEMPRQAACDP